MHRVTTSSYSKSLTFLRSLSRLRTSEPLCQSFPPLITLKSSYLSFKALHDAYFSVRILLTSSLGWSSLLWASPEFCTALYLTLICHVEMSCFQVSTALQAP